MTVTSSKCSMGLVGPWGDHRLRGDFPEAAAATQYVPFPTLGETPDFAADSGWGPTASADSDVQNVAWDFVEYATSTPRSRRSGTSPSATCRFPRQRRGRAGGADRGVPAPRAVVELHRTAVRREPPRPRSALVAEITYPHLLKVLQVARAPMMPSGHGIRRRTRCSDRNTGRGQRDDRLTEGARRWFGGRKGAQRRFVAGVLSPALAYMAVFLMLPIVWAFLLAFFDFSPRRTGSPFLGLGLDNPFVGLEHFRSMFEFSKTAPLEVRQFHTALKVTLIFAFVVLPLNLAITLPLAAMIESVRDWQKVLYRTVFFLPVLTSAVAVAIIWGFVLDPQRGLLIGTITRLTRRSSSAGSPTPTSTSWACRLVARRSASLTSGRTSAITS